MGKSTLGQSLLTRISTALMQRSESTLPLSTVKKKLLISTDREAHMMSLTLTKLKPPKLDSTTLPLTETSAVWLTELDLLCQLWTSLVLREAALLTSSMLEVVPVPVRFRLDSKSYRLTLP